MILTKHKKYFSDSFPSTNRRIDLYEISREFNETNKKFDKNTERFKTYCLPFRKENQAFHDDMKKVHYVPANQYNTETNVLFKKIERQYKAKGYKIPSLSFGKDTVFKDSPIIVKRKSIEKYYLNNPPQRENNDELYEKDKHYKYMEKVNTIISCKANHIDETHLEFKAKKIKKKAETLSLQKR